MSGQLQGKRTLVTGGARGIGRAIAEAFAIEGAVVCIADKGRADVAAKALAAGGKSAFPVVVDVADEASVKALYDEALPRLGGLDIVVNSAGVIQEAPLLETTSQSFDHVIGVNLRGTFLVGREGLRALVAGGGSGRVINIGSDLGILGRETFSPYAASKGGVHALTKSWAREFAPGILVNAIAPGPVDTDMLDHHNTSPEWRAKEEDIALRRIGQPEEIAALAVFLAGPGATFITGQILGPNGGSVMP